MHDGCVVFCAQVNLWVRGFKDGTVDDALDGFKVRCSFQSLQQLDSSLH